MLRLPAGRSHQSRSWPLRRIVATFAWAAGLLVVVASALGALAVHGLTDARDTLVDRIVPAQSAARELSAALADQRGGVQAFLAGGREIGLAQYTRGRDAEAQALETLRTLATQDDARPPDADVDAVETAARTWRAEYAEPAIAAARAGAPLPAVDRGDALFESVRSANEVLLADLRRAQAAGWERLEAAAWSAGLAGIAITAVIVAFLLSTTLALRTAVLRPISLLAAQVRGVVSGSRDAQQTVGGHGPREIIELGEDIDAMRLHILRELDAMQQANRQLGEQARDLERSNRDLEQFAYVASHDLQEPLRKVSSFCQLLQRRYEGQLDERADQYIGFAVDGAQRMQRLINDLLEFSRVGRTTAGLGPVGLGPVVRAAAHVWETTVAETGAEIVVDELPEVRGDRTLLHQLFANLIGNALKFRTTGVSPVVHITAAPGPGDSWEICVTDNGIGIEPEYAEKVFVIFQRLHPRDAYGGTGIGLALAKKIVEFHDGRIWVDTGPRTQPGTTIRFTLPAAPQAGSSTTNGSPAVENETFA
ncbi:sensor histidine kinase [Pseudonocardia asaccharolytica]|uniref:sensor histidine kinase n=1 Tax=Pseudonocardia asaccharolytica TaxID=54010 RepID=UPI001FE1333D|nr:ATP-binding protein [Pseudonocardia asaccharolytica]